jgi:hypothetical protein
MFGKIPSITTCLSLHRQVVERAFGILVQRWGVFWRPLRVKFDKIPLLIRVCCKLHNFCIDRFGVGESITIARGDAQIGDNASFALTDGTGGLGRGRRSDLEVSSNRDTIVARLRTMGFIRPAHSRYSRVNNRI